MAEERICSTEVICNQSNLINGLLICSLDSYHGNNLKRLTECEICTLRWLFTKEFIFNQQGQGIINSACFTNYHSDRIYYCEGKFFLVTAIKKCITVFNINLRNIFNY